VEYFPASSCRQRFTALEAIVTRSLHPSFALALTAFAALPLTAMADPFSGAIADPTLEFRVSGTNPNTGTAFTWSSPTRLDYSVDASTGDIDLVGSYSLRSGQSLGGGTTPLFRIDVQPTGTIGGLLDPATGQRTSIAFDNGGNVDPVLTYGYSASNNTNAALTYTATYTSAIVGDFSLGAQVRSRVAGALVDATGNGVSVGLAPGQSFTQELLLSTDGSTWINAGVDVGGAQSNVSPLGEGDAFFYGAYRNPASGFVVGPNGAWTQMRLVTTFTLSGDSDVASFSGYGEVAPIPEPGEIAFLSAGLGLAAMIARRRRARI
jgi:hypothetical protein